MIKIWDLNKKKLDQIIRCYSKSLWNSDFTIHPHVKMAGDCIYFAKGKTIGVWNLNPSYLPTSPYKEICVQNPKRAIQQLACGSTVLDMEVNGHNLYSLSGKILKIWDRETGQIKHEITINSAGAFTKPEKILVRDRLIFGLADRAIYVWDCSTTHPELALFQSRTQFSAFDKDNRGLHVGTQEGTIYSMDMCRAGLQRTCQTLCPIRISHLRVEGNYLFSQSCISNEYKDDKETVQIFEKQSGQSLYVLDKTTPLFNRIIGMRENIKNMQVHKGVLYVNSYYSDGDAFMQNLFDVDTSVIKTWDFNVG